MAARDARIDSYIAQANDFAKPILMRIREAVHAGCPGVEETLKWNHPSFLHNGKILCGMSAFKEHCHFVFWPGGGKPADADDHATELSYLKKLSDLPAKAVLAGYVKQAVKHADAAGSTRKAAAQKTPRKALPMPRDFSDALKKNKKALKWFEDFSQSHRREYIEWITEAKRPETRAKRIAQAVEWLAEGRARNWKYM